MSPPEPAASPSGALLDAASKPDQVGTQGRKLALAAYVILKSATLYDDNNRFWDRPLRSVQEVLQWHFAEGGAGKPLVLASIEKALFLNGSLVRLDAGTYGAMRFVSRAFDQMEVEDMTFLGALDAQDLRPLVNVFRDAIRARSGEALLASTIPGVRFTRKTHKDDASSDADKIDPKLAAVNAYAAAAAACAEFRAIFLSDGNPSLVRLKRAAQELVSAALRFPDLLVGLTQLPRMRGSAAGHMVNSASFALLLSRKLELPRRSYGELALNAMLSPLGVAQRADVTVAASPENVGGGRAEASARMSAAVAMMRRYGSIARPALVRSAIVHERTVMPKDAAARAYRLGMKPHLFSRVIAVAAAYDLATADALPDEALRRVVAQARNGTLDVDVVALLSEVLGLYPVGSAVRLSDGNLAVVVQAPADPARRASPVVRVLQGTGGRLLDLAQPGATVQIVATVPAEAQKLSVTHCFLL